VILSLGMDYAGQKLAEQLNFYILIGFAVIALCAGYIAGSFGLLVKIYAAGLLLDAALVVPDWPWLNKEPLQWLSPVDDQANEIEQIKGKRKS
jgi:signal peptidase complex subunit 1